MINPFNALRDTYMVKGVAADEDTLFRQRDVIVGYAYEDMFNEGYEPVEDTFKADWVVRRDGKVSFKYTWSCRKNGLGRVSLHNTR